MSAEYEPGLVSVIIPAYNRARLITNALESVRRQTYRPIELMVVDDGSTDGTEAVVETWHRGFEDPELKVQYIRKENGGAPSARNEGLRRSRGEFIQFLDSDDAILPRRIERHQAVLESAPDLMYVWSDWVIRPAEEIMPEVYRAQQDSLPAPEPTLVLGEEQVGVPGQVHMGLFRRRACAAIGRWDIDLERYQDWNYSVRLIAMNWKIAYLPSVEYAVGWHSGPRFEDLEKDPVRKIELLVKAATLTKQRIRSANPTASDERILLRLKIAVSLCCERGMAEPFQVVRDTFERMSFVNTRSYGQLKKVFALSRVVGFPATAAAYLALKRVGLIS